MVLGRMWVVNGVVFMCSLLLYWSGKGLVVFIVILWVFRVLRLFVNMGLLRLNLLCIELIRLGIRCRMLLVCSKMIVKCLLFGLMLLVIGRW